MGVGIGWVSGEDGRAEVWKGDVAYTGSGALTLFLARMMAMRLKMATKSIKSSVACLRG